MAWRGRRGPAGRREGGATGAAIAPVEIITATGVVAGDKAPPAADVVGAIPDAVPVVEAAKAEADELLRGRAARALQGRARRWRAGSPSEPAAGSLEPVSIDHSAAMDAVHLRPWPDARRDGDPRRGGGGGRGCRRRCRRRGGAALGWRGAGNLAVGARGGLAVGLGPAASTEGDAVAGGGVVTAGRHGTGGGRGG